MNKILVPINFSAGSANALKYANRLAEILEKDLTLFYCYAVQNFNRKFDFGRQEYGEGVREMLSNFYQKTLGVTPSSTTKFITRAGFVGEEIIQISKDYDLLVINTNYFKSGFKRWMESRASAIASTAKCPVLITSSSTYFRPWKNVWHLKRKDNESTIVQQYIATLPNKQPIIKEKNFEQKAFISPLWQAMVSFKGHPDKKLLAAVEENLKTEKIDLLILVSHQKDTFQQFLSSDLMQLIFHVQIPILVIQDRKVL